MGAVCCRNQSLDAPLLSLSAATIVHELDPRAAAASSSSPATPSLASYHSFSFPFTFKSARGAPQSTCTRKTSYPADRKNGTTPSKARDVWMPYVGEHWRRTSRGTCLPLSLVDLSIRSLCAQLVVHPPHARKQITWMPPEVASKVLQWLREHYLLEKVLFQALAPLLLSEWNLEEQVQVDDSWFNDIPATTVAEVRHINVAGCIHLQQFGSERKRMVRKLPKLVIASFRDCSKLSSGTIELLSFSRKLTTLNLSGCDNLDDTSLKRLSCLNLLKSLQLTGCSNLTDKGIKYTANLPRLKKLYCGGCRRVTDGAFDAPFKALKKLDATNCRLTDKAMEHIGRLRSLNSLVIRGCQQISDNATRLLSGLTKMKYFDARHCSRIHSIPTEWTQLQVLLLGYTAFAEADTAVLQQLMELQELELRRCRIMKRGFQFISRLHNLERLDLGETPLTDSGLLEICDSVRKLKALNISNTEVSDTGTHGLAKLKELRILHMDTQGVTSNALMNVACLVHLEKLDLFGANITDNGLLHLVQLHHLQELTICGGKISDRGVGIISKLTSLTILNLSQNGNIRTKSLFYLRSLTGLRSLNLSDTGISALSLRHLSPLKELQSLSVYGCSLSQKHIDLLRGTRKDRFWILGTEFKVLVSFLRALFSKPAGAQMLAVYLML